MTQMNVQLIDHMGSDLSVVNAARVSFSKESQWVQIGEDTGTEYPLRFEPFEDFAISFTEVGDETKEELSDATLSKADAGLIRFLARGCSSKDWEKLLDRIWYEAYEMPEGEVEDLVNHIRKMPTHWTPFAHTSISLRIKAPIFIARQYGKHQAGLVWNEVSRRYVDEEPEFFMPDAWRKRAENVKQGSSDETIPFHDLVLSPKEEGDAYFGEAVWDTQELTEYCNMFYDFLLRNGVCPEQARMVLPQSMMTEWIWTGNLYSFANVFIQRTNSHAQKEAQDLAHMIGDVIKPLFPVSWEALTS
nr:FAD-dependent thymidylate synthase [uncultured Cohaesibacter sp.]